MARDTRKSNSEREPRGRVAEGTGVAVRSIAPGQAGRDRARLVERAMSDAVLESSAEGITDPKIVRQRMLEARDRIRAGE